MAAEPAPTAKRARVGIRPEFSDSGSEVWLSFGSSYAGQEKPNRAVAICRAWMNIEQDLHRLVMELIGDRHRFEKKEGRTFWARPLSLLLAKIS